MNNYTVYLHICPNNKKYVGITKQKPEIRWNYGNGYRPCVLFYKAIKKYGWYNIKHKILYEGLTKEEAEQKEIELIAKYKTKDARYGYNICDGGNGTNSHKVTEETKMLISKKTKEAMNNEEVKWKIAKVHLGKPLSEEHRKKISYANKGKPSKLKGIKLTKEHKKNISKNHARYWLGKTMSKEMRKKLSLSHLGKPNIALSKKVRCIETGKTYISASEAERQTNIKHISCVCNGARKIAGGYHWKYEY